MLPILLLLTGGHWSAPVPIWAKNPTTLRWYQTQGYYWVDAVQPQLAEPERTWEIQQRTAP